MVKKSLSRIYLAIIFLFLYLPIGVLIVLSFNNSLSRVKWGGFTTEWYRNLVSDPTIMNAFLYHDSDYRCIFCDCHNNRNHGSNRNQCHAEKEPSDYAWCN